MSEPATPEVKQARMKEFLSLLPLTIEIAGLPACPGDRIFTADQMEARVLALRTGFKIARNLVREVGDSGI